MALDRDFERFDGGPLLSTRERLHITLRPKGDIFLNANAHRLLGRPEAVAMYYSPERETIAIEPANPRQPKNFLLIKAQSGWRIRSWPFCRHYGIRVQGTQRFVSAEITSDGHLMLELRRTVNVPSYKKKRAAAAK